jgi:hypothetical protein
LAVEAPDPEAAAAVSCAAVNDPSEAVRAAARAVLRGWCSTSAGAGSLLRSLISACGGAPGPGGIFYLGDFLINGGLRVMPVTPTDRDQRIEAAADRIREAVAELPDAGERREAGINALVGSVPRAAGYREQLQAFTGITHVMRLKMAQQLEPGLRAYLQDSAPPRSREGEAGNGNPYSVQAEQARFARDLSDGVFRLGLGLSWKGGGPCYVSTLTEKRGDRSERTRYRIMRCGKGDQQVGLVTAWGPAQTDRIGLRDAAPAGQENCLTPVRGR